MLDYIYTAVYMAFCSVALVIILRNAPIIRGWVIEMKKPWACNVCLPLYTCAAVTALLWYFHHNVNVFWAYLPSYAMSYMTLEGLARPPSVVPTFDLKDSEE